MARELDPYRLRYAGESLHEKAHTGDIAVRRWLADGGDPNVRADNGQTLLHAAVHGGHLGIASLLIVSGVDVNACSDEAGYHTYPVQTAVYDGRLDLVDVLATHGADTTVETENGCTLIHLAVLGDSLPCMQYLIDRGADVEIPAASGVTPLCSATMHGYREASELLLRAGANPNAEYAGGLTPLAQNHDSALTEILIAYGADVNHIGDDGRSPLFHVESAEVLEVLLAHGARLDVIDAAGDTLLHQAAAEMIVIEFDDETDRAVHRASTTGMRIAQLFVEHGLDINVRNCDGQTPLAVAVEEENDEMAAFLRARGGIGQGWVQ